MNKWLFALPLSLGLLLAGCDTGSDTTAPTVTLTASPTTLTAAGAVTLNAAASDSSGIASVKFYRAGTLIGTDTDSPYSYSDSISSSGTYTYTAVATDASSNANTATSSAATVTANISGSTGGTGAGTAAEVLSAANAFLATLSSSQQSSVVLPYNSANAIKWSNLPTTMMTRSGLSLGSLTSAQQTAALAVVKAAMGTANYQGYNEAELIRMADDVLAKSQSNDYGSGKYYIAFLGTPSSTGTWQLQFGGHHLALNVTYGGGKVTGVTPNFTATEPKCWTVTGSTTTANDCAAPSTSSSATSYAPLYYKQKNMVDMLASLSSTQLASAKLSTTFSDILLGPGKDGQFPSSKSGLAVSSLSSAQKALVLAAIKPWVQAADDATTAALLATYESELDSTYIAFSGNASLSNKADYVRIDGPSVWIELVCQGGIVYPSTIHYHTIWRDHTRDYGANFSF